MCIGGVALHRLRVTMIATLEAQIKANRATQATISKSIVLNNENKEVRDALINILLEHVQSCAELEAQLTAAFEA